MYETTQKILKMNLEEFKKWEVPKGWELMYANGHKVYPTVSMIPEYNNSPYFEMTVTIEKEK